MTKAVRTNWRTWHWRQANPVEKLGWIHFNRPHSQVKCLQNLTNDLYLKLDKNASQDRCHNLATWIIDHFATLVKSASVMVKLSPAWTAVAGATIAVMLLA